LQGLPRRQVEPQRAGHLVRLVLDAAREPHLAGGLLGTKLAARLAVRRRGARHAPRALRPAASQRKSELCCANRRGSELRSRLRAGVTLQVGLSLSMLPRFEPRKTINPQPGAQNSAPIRLYLTFIVDETVYMRGL